MLNLKDFLHQNQLRYETLSKTDAESKGISSVSLGYCGLIGIGKVLPPHQSGFLTGHAMILEPSEVQGLLEEELPCFLPEVFILVSDTEVDKFMPVVQDFASNFSSCSVVYVMSKISARELYLALIKEIGAQAQFMRELLYTHYINLAHLLTQDVEIGDIEMMAYTILENPMIITDESYKVIAFSRAIEINDPIWMTIVGNDYCPSDIVEMTDHNNFWQRLSRAGRPLFVDSEGFLPYARRAVAEVRAGGKIRGYIALLEINKTIKELDLQMLQMVAELVGVKLAEKNAVSKALGQLEHEFIRDLFSGAMANEKMARSRALSIGWKLSRWFAILSVRPRKKDEYIGTKLDFIKEKLSSFFPLCIYSFNGRSAYYIVGFEDRSRWKKLLDGEVEKVMLQENLVCCAGLPVDTLMGVQESYEQARKTAKSFQFLKGDLAKGSVHVYSELAVYDTLLELAKRDDITSMMSRALLHIQEVDEKEGSEYVKTLKCFFENNQNVGATADAMFLHRNTINYRLNKIRSLLEEDFDNPLIRLHLHISLMIDDMSSQ